MTKELECTTESGKLFHKQIVWGEKNTLIGTNNWTNKRQIVYVSALKKWYSLNKISIGAIDNPFT